MIQTTVAAVIDRLHIVPERKPGFFVKVKDGENDFED